MEIAERGIATAPMTDAYLPETWVDRKTAIDELEPLEREDDDLRDAAVKYVALINAFSTAIERALSDPRATLQNVRTAYWGIAFGLGLNSTCGRTVTEMAESIGV